MKKWFVLGLTTLCSFSTLAIEHIDKFSSKHNPTSMRYYLEHYQNTDSEEYRNLLIGVRAAADTVDFYTTTLESTNQRIDYCLPMIDVANRDTLWRWKTKDLMALMNDRIEQDPRIKKYGKAGIGGGVGNYLVMALKEQYPCPVQKQRPL